MDSLVLSVFLLKEGKIEGKDEKTAKVAKVAKVARRPRK